MGVYIPNMEMPTGNPEEPTAVWIYPDGGVKVFYNCGKEIVNTRAITVPDHGDLIVRDKLRNTMFVGEQCLYSWDEVEDAIDYAPTIIPADEPFGKPEQLNV